jgi:hypothetical protein
MAEKLDIVISIVDKATQQLQKFQKGVGNLSQRADKLGKNFTVAGAAITGGIALMVNGASDLQESINAVNVTFGDAADKILEFGEGAAKKAGLSMAEFNQAIIPIGALLNNMGFEADAAAESSIALTQRAADLASVFNTSVQDALIAIGSGLRGQTEPLLAYGSNLSAVEVKAHALATGIVETNRELTESEKVAARLSLLMSQTEQAAGDFANTSDSLANMMRILGADVKNTSANLSGALIPIIEKVLQRVKVVLDAIANWIKANPELAETITVVIAGIGAALLVLGPLFIIIGKIIGAVGGLIKVMKALKIIMLAATGPIGVIIAAIAGLVAGVLFLRKVYPDTWNTMVDVTRTAVQFIVDVFINSLIDAFNLLMSILGNTDAQVQTITLSFDALKVSADEATGGADQFSDSLGEGVDVGFDMNKILAGLGGGMGEFGKASGSAGKSFEDVMKDMGNAAEDFSKDMNSALGEVQKNIIDLQRQLEELVIGKIEDTNEERVNLAQAFVDQEKDLADLRERLRDEEDNSEREQLRNKIQRLEEDLEANKSVELAVAQEIKKIREDEQKTSLQLAKEKFQKNIFFIEQEFEKKAKKIKEELKAELEKEQSLLEIRKKASDLAQQFLLNEEKQTIDSVNRQIAAFNQLAKAIQNSKSGITTGSVGLGETLSAQQRLQEIAASSGPITININNPNILDDEDLIEKVGDPIVANLKNHLAVV